MEILFSQRYVGEMRRALRPWYINFPRFHGFRGGQHPKFSRGASLECNETVDLGKARALVTISVLQQSCVPWLNQEIFGRNERPRASATASLLADGPERLLGKLRCCFPHACFWQLVCLSKKKLNPVRWTSALLMASANPHTLLHSARIPGRALLTGTMCEGGKDYEGEGVVLRPPHRGGSDIWSALRAAGR